MHEFSAGQQVVSTLSITNQFVFLSGVVEKLLYDPSLLAEYKKSFSDLDGDRKARRELRVTITNILKGNALRHLAEIDKHYKQLENTIPQ
ncbi:hypothetical protein D3C76_1412590 [compost metagenome]